jgi:hypothetical protein
MCAHVHGCMQCTIMFLNIKQRITHAVARHKSRCSAEKPLCSAQKPLFGTKAAVFGRKPLLGTQAAAFGTKATVPRFEPPPAFPHVCSNHPATPAVCYNSYVAFAESVYRTRARPKTERTEYHRSFHSGGLLQLKMRMPRSYCREKQVAGKHVAGKSSSTCNRVCPMHGLYPPASHMNYNNVLCWMHTISCLGSTEGVAITSSLP